MKSGFKSPEQIRFTDLAGELKKRFGFSQNQIAEMVNLSPAGVSQIVNGKRSPGRAVLQLLENGYRELTEPKSGATRTAPDELREQLGYLEQHYPPGFEAAKATVRALHKQAIQGVSSKVAGIAESGMSSASEAAKSELPKSPPAQSTAVPSARKRGRGRGSGPH